jgi:hypothetical protein
VLLPAAEWAAPRGRNRRGEGSRVPTYWLIPWSLVALSVVLVGLIYWGGFIEERRNGRPRG